MKLSNENRVKFAGDRFWWTVRATDGERFAILTRQATFHPRGTSVYTIIDWERGVRGPCNLIGQGWGVDEPNGCDDLLKVLRGEDEFSVEVSYRNNVVIDIIAKKAI